MRESRSRPSCGIVEIRTRGINQRAEVVIEFTRSFMVFKRSAPEVEDTLPRDRRALDRRRRNRMRIDVTMPNLGYDMEEGTVQRGSRASATASSAASRSPRSRPTRRRSRWRRWRPGTLVEIVCEAGADVAVGAVIAVHRERRLRWTGSCIEQTRMRAGIARRMVESKQQAPHFYVQTEVAVDGGARPLAELQRATPTRRA